MPFFEWAGVEGGYFSALVKQFTFVSEDDQRSISVQQCDSKSKVHANISVSSSKLTFYFGTWKA